MRPEVAQHLRHTFFEFLAGSRCAQQDVASLDEDGPLLGDQLVVAPGVRVYVEHPPLGDALRVAEQCPRLRAGDAAGLVALHGQLAQLQVRGDDFVLPAGEEHRGTRIALAAGASPKLVVQPLGVVPPGADDMQTSEFGDGVLLRGVVGGVRTAESDVGAPARHLCRHRHCAEHARLGDDTRLLLVVLGIENDGGNSTPHEPGVQVLRLGDVVGAHQDGLAGDVQLDDVVDDPVVLRRGGDVDPVGLVGADIGGVGRNG